MRVLIAGVDGYLGWPLALHLAARGHEVAGADFFLRRRWVTEMGGHSAIPIAPMQARRQAFAAVGGRPLPFWEADLRDYRAVRALLGEVRPEAVVHLAQLPSSAYSMVDVHHCVLTQTNNLVTTLNLLHALREVTPEAHLVKLGSLGEYGTPDLDIPEGSFEIQHRGRRDRLPFPHQGGSWHDLSKVHDSHNIRFACRAWGLRATDLLQGVVYGTSTPEMEGDGRLRTRLDFDQAFGTVVHRFACQAVIGEPLTPFGSGGQKRGVIPLGDAMTCLTLALENPPGEGEYRVFHQFAQVLSVLELAGRVQEAAATAGLEVEIRRLENPRAEPEDHHLNPDRRGLAELGYRPTLDMASELRRMLGDLLPHQDRIRAKRGCLLPDIRWDGSRAKVGELESGGQSAAPPAADPEG